MGGEDRHRRRHGAGRRHVRRHPPDPAEVSRCICRPPAGLRAGDDGPGFLAGAGDDVRGTGNIGDQSLWAGGPGEKRRSLAGGGHQVPGHRRALLRRAPVRVGPDLRRNRHDVAGRHPVRARCPGPGSADRGRRHPRAPRHRLQDHDGADARLDAGRLPRRSDSRLRVHLGRVQSGGIHLRGADVLFRVFRPEAGVGAIRRGRRRPDDDRRKPGGDPADEREAAACLFVHLAGRLPAGRISRDLIVRHERASFLSHRLHAGQRGCIFRRHRVLLRNGLGPARRLCGTCPAQPAARPGIYILASLAGRYSAPGRLHREAVPVLRGDGARLSLGGHRRCAEQRGVAVLLPSRPQTHVRHGGAGGNRARAGFTARSWPFSCSRPWGPSGSGSCRAP